MNDVASPFHLPDGLRSTGAPSREGAEACESCGSTGDLLPDGGAGIVFCADCAAPVSSIAFSEYYLDLGGGD